MNERRIFLVSFIVMMDGICSYVKSSALLPLLVLTERLTRTTIRNLSSFTSYGMPKSRPISPLPNRLTSLSGSSPDMTKPLTGKPPMSRISLMPLFSFSLDSTSSVPVSMSSMKLSRMIFADASALMSS